MLLYKNQFLLIFSFLSIPIELWESTAAIFRQSAVNVHYLDHYSFLPSFKPVLYPLLILDCLLSFWIKNVFEDSAPLLLQF